MTEALHLAAPQREAQVAEALRDHLTAQNCPVQLWIAHDDTHIARAIATHDYYSAVFSSDTAVTDVADAARQQDHEAVIERRAVVASSPLVIGWSREAAEHLGRQNLGWQALRDQSERSDFRVVHASGTGSTGRWTLAALAKIAARDSGDSEGDLLRRIQSRTTGYAGNDLEISDLLLGQPVDAFVAQEDAAHRACLATEGRYLISMPQEGTFLIQRPLLVARVGGYVNEERLQREIELFDTFEPSLSSSPWHAKLSELGYRDPQGLVTPTVILQQYAVPPPPFPSYWEAPTASAMAAIPGLWAEVKRPASILLLLDTSGSMSGGKLEAAQRAIRQFLVNIVGTQDRLGLTTFGSTINEVVLLEPVASATAKIKASLDLVTAAGNTPLFDSVNAAVDQFEWDTIDQREGDTGTRMRVVVLLSDGADNASRLRQEIVTARVRDTADLLIYAVSYPGGSEDTLNSLVSAGRGQVHQSDPQSIVRVYETISRRL